MPIGLRGVGKTVLLNRFGDIAADVGMTPAFIEAPETGDFRTLLDTSAMLGVKVESVAPRRSQLIAKGVIFSPAHGDTAFTVPLFDECLRRTMPSWRPPGGGGYGRPA